MYLARLTLANFRAFRSADFVLPPEGLLLVAGPNNVGKSALLSALDIVAGRGIASPFRFHGSSDPAVLRATFQLTGQDRHEIAGGGPNAQDWLENTRVLSSVTLQFTDAFGPRMYLAELETEDVDGQAWVFSRLEVSPAQGVAWFDITQQLNNIPLGGAQPMRGQGFQQRIQPGDFDYLRTNSPGAPGFARLLGSWSAALYHFSAIRTGTPRHSPIGDVTPELAPSGENLAQALLYHSSQRTSVWDRVRALIAEVLPDAGELVVPAAGSQLQIAFIDPTSGEMRNLKDLGSGVEQLLMTSYVGETQPAGSVTLIEEPETSLHPSAQRELLRHLERLSEDRLLIATTHSSVVLDSRSARSQGCTWMVRRSAGVSELTEVSADLAPAVAELGVRLSDVLSADHIVLVEGETDAEILRTWFAERLTRSGTAVVPMGGGDRAFQLDTIERVLAGSDRLQRKFLFIRDRDELQDHSLTELEERGVAVLSRRELENYFLDQTSALLKALAERREGSSIAGDETSMDLALRAAADRLREVVVFKRVVQALPSRLLTRRKVNELIRTNEANQAGLREALSTANARTQSAVEGLGALWQSEEVAVHEVWEAEWRDLAPGSEVLSEVWRQAGFRYDKAKDGGRIARAMPNGPEELSELLDAFLAG